MEDNRATIFLGELARRTNGELALQSTMEEVGEGVGLDKNEASALAEELIMEGLVELKTLAGGIALTGAGLAALGMNPEAIGKPGVKPLGCGPHLSAEDVAAVQRCIEELRSCYRTISRDPESLEGLVLDVKTLEVQLLSPRPKTAIVSAILASCLECIEADPAVAELRGGLRAMLGERQ